jgi:hypothetical protein
MFGPYATYLVMRDCNPNNYGEEVTEQSPGHCQDGEEVTWIITKSSTGLELGMSSTNGQNCIEPQFSVVCLSLA